ncbi:unnamed protein product [Eruca vesicaria subsp. sativa]|uniref:Isopenicillin N synthase-like Fe(2+) 2OG dioxygenase domain-containing protein n=1 Tax=Eruca vesicaria subsp. sativa TaxID=29727 RepID=A0ABC8JG34_ERUVS|nr:unnamed protein product [Eruca vesicaria subsp. sativa]
MVAYSKEVINDMGCTNSLLPLRHFYPPCIQPELTLRLTKLSDNSFLTVLLQDHGVSVDLKERMKDGVRRFNE